VIARNHEASTFALTCTAAYLSGVPPLGCLLLGVWGAMWGDWPDIDAARSRATQALCLVRYPIRALDRDGRQKVHERGARAGRLKWTWRSFPGHQLHRVSLALSEAVFDFCATEADQDDVAGPMGPKFRGHRGLTHSVWWALGSGALVWLALAPLPELPPEFAVPIFGPADPRILAALGAVVGVIGHILGDCCTDYGCAPFAPLLRWNGRRYVEMGIWEPLRFKVSHDVEALLITPVCLVLAGLSALAALGWLGGLLSAVHVWWASLVTPTAPRPS
jgi:membrane-bound metal-dependent hydrolase YbcI (DUF457 family)